MTRFAVDTSCMVAIVCSWHEQHHAATRAVERRLRRGEHLTVAAHALMETYAVLTRLPAPHRLAAADAWTLIHANFIEQATTIALDGDEQVSLLKQLAEASITGGRSYDAVIGACARKGRSAALLTLNPRHFQAAPDGVVVETP